MSGRTEKELIKAFMSGDVEAWKEYVGDFDSMTDFQKDWSLMEYENLIDPNRDEMQKNPDMLLQVRLGKMINLALKHNIDPIKPYGEVLSLREEQKKRN